MGSVRCRYMGYANELGESFKASISRGLYVGTYAVAVAYALGDALDKGLRAHHRVQNEHVAATRKDAVDSRCEYLSMPVRVQAVCLCLRARGSRLCIHDVVNFSESLLQTGRTAWDVSRW